MRSFLSEVKFLLARLRSKDSFVRNFAVTFSWNSAAVVIGFLFTPFIARLYSPEAYGLFAVYMSLAQNVSLIATLQLTRAYTLAESEQELQGLLRATLYSTVLLIMFVVVICLLFKDQVLNFFNITPIGSFIYLLPLTAFLYSLCDVYRSWNVRHKFFQRNAVNQVVASVTARSLAVSYALVMPVKHVGLIVGDLISKVIESIHLGWAGAFHQANQSVFSSSKVDTQKTLRRFKNYPMFVLPSSLITVFASQIPLFFVTKFYDAESAGFYSLANSMLTVPVSVLAGAIAPIFLQRVSDAYRVRKDQVGYLVIQVANKLFYIGVVPILILTIYGDWLFRVVFGESWIQSGVLAGYMGFYFLFTVINFPLLSIYRIVERERFLLVVTVIHVVINILALWSGHQLFKTVDGVIIIFSISNVIFYLINIAVIFTIAGIKTFKHFIRWTFVGALLYALIRALRILMENWFNWEML